MSDTIVIKKYVSIGIILLFFGIFFLDASSRVFAQVCPLPGDTKVNKDLVNGNCYSKADPLFNTGLNTTGGTVSCGPVKCVASDPYPDGAVCIVKIGNSCFSGKGPSGFNTPQCTPLFPNNPLPQCPQPMDLTMKVIDQSGNGVANVTLTVSYEDAPPSDPAGKTATITTDANGNAVLKNTLYSGDHFIIAPSSPSYSFQPPTIGSTQNVGDQEMNTTFSCGTALEIGGSRPPCTFTATQVIPTAIPSLAPPEDSPQSYTPTDSVRDTTFLVAFILGFGLFISHL